MNTFEQSEIQNIPEKYRPIGAWAYFGLNILYAIPIVGFIFLIIHACSSGNINRRSFARSFFCVWIVAAIVVLITLLAAGGIAGLGAIFSNFGN